MEILVHESGTSGARCDDHEVLWQGATQLRRTWLRVVINVDFARSKSLFREVGNLAALRSRIHVYHTLAHNHAESLMQPLLRTQDISTQAVQD